MRSWREVRPQVVTDEARVAEHRAKVEAAARRIARISAGLNQRLAGK